jgi:hypothetical protein
VPAIPAGPLALRADRRKLVARLLDIPFTQVINIKEFVDRSEFRNHALACLSR